MGNNSQQMIENIASDLGSVVLISGAMHFMNLYAFTVPATPWQIVGSAAGGLELAALRSEGDGGVSPIGAHPVLTFLKSAVLSN